MDVFHTTDDVIDALGGNMGVGRLLGCKPKRVSDWRMSQEGQFPAKTFFVLQQALKAAGKSAPVSLWGMRELAIEGENRSPAGLQGSPVRPPAGASAAAEPSILPSTLEYST